MHKSIANFTKIGVVGLSVMSLTACLGPATKPSVTQTVDLNTADVMPSKSQLKNEKPKLVVFPLRSSDSLAKKYKLGDVGATTMYSTLMSSSVEVVDRQLLKDLQKEIEKAEFVGLRGESVNNAVADYALVGDISAVSVGSSFTERRVWQDKEGKTHVSPAHCTYRGQVTGIYKIVSLQNGKTLENFELNDSVSSSTETTNSRCPISNGTEENLAKGAVVDAVEDAEYKLKIFFAPKGYVINAQETPDGKEFFVQISIGKDQNVKPGDDVLFYETRKIVNKITGKETEEEANIGKGTVMTDMTQNEAWVKVDNDFRQQMKIGAVAKIDHTSVFGSLSTKLPF